MTAGGKHDCHLSSAQGACMSKSGHAVAKWASRELDAMFSSEQIGRTFRILSIFSNGAAGIRTGLPGSESAQNRESKAGFHNHGR